MSNNPLRSKSTSSSDNLPGRLTMAIGRGLDPVLQYNLLRQGWAGSALEAIGAKNMVTLPLVNSVGLGLNGFRTVTSWGYVDKPGNLLVFATGIASLRHLYWSLVQCESAFPPLAGASISVYNLLLTTLNTFVLVYRISKGKTNPLKSGWAQYVGLGLVLTGTVGEVVIEKMRKSWKLKGGNKGKVYDEGAFGVVRHPNYALYTLWRIGFASITGSLTNVILQTAFQIGFFSQFSVGELGDYMQKRYGAEYTAYKKRVPYALIPFVY